MIYTDTYGSLIYKKIAIKHQESYSKPFLQRYVGPNLSANSVATIPPQYFNGFQLRDLYNVPTVNVASGSKKVTIAIIIAYTYPKLKQDLAIYWQNPINFGPSSTPPAINVYTMPGATQNSGWAQEECLDVQMVCTMNPNANIWVVEAKTSSNTDMMNAVTYATNTIKADVVSMSWGQNEYSQLNASNNIFTNTAVCYCAASGDSNTVSWPATNTNCVAVGGTSLIWTPTATPERTEYAWNLAGCGYSSIISQPNYQTDISGIIHNYRAIPDLAMVADSNTCVYTVYNGNWYGVGGTSVATPIFAGIISLANQMRFNAGKSALTTVYSTTPNTATSATYVPPARHVQTYLYKTVYPNKSQYSSLFYDVSVGTNKGSASNSTTLVTYTAFTGFDITTGLGSPNGSNLCNGLLNI